jgi:hypothetical protein
MVTDRFLQVLQRKRASGAPPGPTLVKFEDFQSAAAGSNNLSDITGWVSLHNTIGTSDLLGGKYAFPASAGPANAGYRWDTGADSLDQRVECEVTALDGAGNIGPCVRCQAGAVSYYALYITATNLYLYEWNAGSAAEVTSLLVTTDVGDKLALIATGSGAATRLNVEMDTGGGWVNVISDANPATDLGEGKGGIGSFGDTQMVGLDNWYWYDL